MKRLTPHQAEVFGRIVKRYLRTGEAVDAREIRSAGACAHLDDKGYVMTLTTRGPRGGELLAYLPTPAGLKTVGK